MPIDLENFEVRTLILKSNGIYLVIINDAESHVLQPVISCIVETFQFTKDVKYG